jgi:hypothetical protein
MADPSTAHRPKGFLDLPGEIKNIVYDLVLQGSKLKLDRNARDRLNVKDLSSPLDLSTTKNKNALLGTCRTIREEAMPILAQHTTLDVRDAFMRADPLQILPPVFLCSIRTLVIDLNAFVHVNRNLLPCLKQVTLVHRVDGLADFEEALHILYCRRCGGPFIFLTEGVSDVLDWKWMKKQIAHLSEEEGWDVTFSLLWECYTPPNSSLVSCYLLLIHSTNN